MISSNSVKSGEFPWLSLYVMDTTGSTGSVAPQVSSITVKVVGLSSRSLTKNATMLLDRVASGSETTESTVAPYSTISTALVAGHATVEVPTTPRMTLTTATIHSSEQKKIGTFGVDWIIRIFFFFFLTSKPVNYTRSMEYWGGFLS